MSTTMALQTRDEDHDPYGSSSDDDDDSDDLFSEQFKSDSESDDDDVEDNKFTPPPKTDRAPSSGGGGGARDVPAGEEAQGSGAPGGNARAASGGGGPGGIGDVNNPNRRKHKYTTADMDDGTNKWMKCLQIVCMFLLALAIMIGISIGMNKLFNSPELVPDAPEAAAAEAEASLPKTRDYVEDMCTPDKIGGSERIFCETACEPYHGCCDIFTSQNGTCYKNEISGCYSYAKCHGLNGHIDPANDNLDRICNPRALHVNRAQCEEMCEPVRCCWDDAVTSCVDEYYEACQDYSHCQNLRQGLIVPVAATDLDVQCRRNSPYCRRSCNEARCCTDEFSDCYRTNFIACLSYTPCNTLNNTSVVIHVPELRSRLPPAPSDLRIFCSGQHFNENPEPCEFACEVASCCWASGPNNCFGFDPLGCLEYIKCSALYGDISPVIGVEEDTAEEDSLASRRFTRNHEYIKNTCGELELANAEDRALCSTACFNTIGCCNPFQQDRNGISGDPEISLCYREEMAGCYTYSGCHALDNFFPPAPDSIHDLCGWDVVLQNPSDCEAMCDEVRCCWDDAVIPCLDAHYGTCQDYAACQNLRADAAIRVAPPGLEVECLLEESEICADACMHADDCCGDPFSECYRLNFIACLSYSVCTPGTAMSSDIGSIHTILPQAPATLGEICSLDYVNQTGSIAECRQACQEAMCCFNHDRDYCFGADPLGCLEYAHCRVLLTYVAPPTLDPTQIPTVYLPPEPATTVVAPPPADQAAQTTEGGGPEAPYDPAAELTPLVTPAPVSPPPTTFPPTTPPPAQQFSQHRYNIQSLCPYTGTAANPDTAPCQSNCEASNFTDCCNPFDADSAPPGNCPEGFLAQGCYSYARCHSSGNYGDSMLPPSNLDRNCAMNTLQLDWSQCMLACNNLGCCWDESEQSCLATHFDVCMDWSPCLNLNSGIRGKQTFSGGTHLEVAPERLDQYCAPGASDRNRHSCDDACQLAQLCCSDPNSECYRDNFMSCLSYSACNQREEYADVFPLPPAHASLPPVDPEAIRSACAPANPDDLNQAACDQVCQPSDCCWSNIEESCFGTDPMGCTQYKLCAWSHRAVTA